MNVLLCGVRGSMPASGADFDAVGGHTSCVAVEAADGRLLVLDAGTGFSRLAGELGTAPFRGSILLTHLHWDHMHGLPFLGNADRDDAEAAVHVPLQGGETALELLSRSMSPPSFPIEPNQLRGAWSFSSIDVGVSMIEGFEVAAAEIAHKGGRTFGYRVADDRGAFAYLPDHSPRTATPVQLEAAHRLIDGVDVLFHGGQFREAERTRADAFGHATVSDAVELAVAGGVGELVVVHHAPARSDDTVATMAAEAISAAAGTVAVTFGREGDRWSVGASRS